MSRFLEHIERLIQAPTTTPESRERLLRARETALATYAIGESVRVKGIDEPLTVVDRLIYGPKAQWYDLAHEDASWQPPNGLKGLSVNRNYDRPRISVTLGDIVGHEPELEVEGPKPVLKPIVRAEKPLEELFPSWTAEARAKWKLESEARGQAVREVNERYFAYA